MYNYKNTIHSNRAAEQKKVEVDAYLSYVGAFTVSRSTAPTCNEVERFEGWVL